MCSHLSLPDGDVFMLTFLDNLEHHVSLELEEQLRGEAV